MAGCHDKYIDLMAGVPQIAGDFIALRKSAVLGQNLSFGAGKYQGD
jgi:hypothetical protein